MIEFLSKAPPLNKGGASNRKLNEVEILILAAILCNEGLILTVIGIVGFVEGLRLNRVSAAADEAYGPGWYLILLSLILIVCGFFYLASTFKRSNRKSETKFSLCRPAFLCIILMILYNLLLPYLGYFVSTVAFLFVATRAFGEESWVGSTLLAGISGAAFFLVFIYLAEIPMP